MSAAYYPQVQKIYVAYYGRPADPAGLQYWAGQLAANGGNLTSIINAFGNSAESTALYAGADNSAKVTAIYQAMFNRAPDAPGLAFYTAELTAGRMTAASIALNVANGAQGTDATYLNNKVTVGTAFTDALTVDSAAAVAYSGTTAITAARSLISGVTTSAATTNVASTITSIKAGGGAAAGQTFTLTNSAVADAPVLTSGNDTVNSPAGTLASADRVIDGSNADADILNVTVNGYTAGAVQPTVIGVETVNVDGAYTTAGFDATNLIGATTLNLSAQIGAATATVDAATANAAKTIAAKANITTLNVNTPAGGTGPELNVNAGGATTVALVGGAGADLVKLAAAAGSTLTLTSGITSTADSLTLNLSGGANTATFGTANGWDTLNINSNTAANTLTLGDAVQWAGTATGNNVTIGGSQALTIVGDGDAIGGTTRTDGFAVSKATGAGTVTFTNNAASTATFFNEVVIDTIDLTTVIAGTAITVNEATTLKLSFDQTSAADVTYNVDNNGATQMTANTGTLRLDVAASQTKNDIIIGAQVGTVLLSANTANVTIASLDTNASGNTVETVAISGNKNVTITAFTNDTDDVLAANALTGNLTVTAMTAAGVVIGGSGNDSLTIGANFAAVLRGGAGSDTINGAGATGSRVTAYGDAGDDNITGGGIADLLDGGDGADLITAGAGADTVLGGAGSDTIVGGTVADSMTGGAGDDVFQFAAADTGTPSGTVFETITDWAAGDRIDFTGGAITVVANTTSSAGTAAISAAGLASFNSADNTLALKVVAVEAGIATGTAAAGQSAVFVHGSDTYLFISDGNDGVDANDVMIKLVGVNATTGITINASGDITVVA